jgi:hypothetical protein
MAPSKVLPARRVRSLRASRAVSFGLAKLAQLFGGTRRELSPLARAGRGVARVVGRQVSRIVQRSRERRLPVSAVDVLDVRRAERAQKLSPGRVVFGRELIPVKKKRVCEARQERREVLFATGNAGSNPGPRRRGPQSREVCL